MSELGLKPRSQTMTSNYINLKKNVLLRIDKCVMYSHWKSPKCPHRIVKKVRDTRGWRSFEKKLFPQLGP